MINLKNEISENKILVIIVSNQSYSNKAAEIAKAVSGSKRVCYVALNKPYATVVSKLKSKMVDTSKFIFVDAITKSNGKNAPDNVVLVSSPKALTELNITINKILEVGKVENLIFDSLSTLLVYERPMTIVKFVHALTAKLRTLNVTAVFIALKDDVAPELLKNLYMFADKVVTLDN